MIVVMYKQIKNYHFTKIIIIMMYVSIKKIALNLKGIRTLK